MSSRSLIQTFTLVAAALYFAAAIAFFFGFAPVTSTWPWPEPAMSYIFLASIVMAVVAPLVWIGITAEFAALAPLSLNVLVVHGGAFVFLATRIASGERHLAVATVIVLLQAIAALLLLRWSRRIPIRDPRPTPSIVRWAFVAFTAALLIVGTALVLQRPQIFPWNLAPATSTIFGLLFFGASTYFAYGVARPQWTFSAGQLWGFLAYDVVLFIPYARMLLAGPGALDEYGYGGAGNAVNMPSLVVYLSVLAASALLALYVFAVDRRTRIFGDQLVARSR